MWVVNSLKDSVQVTLSGWNNAIQGLSLAANTATYVSGTWSIVPDGSSPPVWTDEVYLLEREPTLTDLGILARIAALEGA